MNTVFVIMGTTGEYSDREEWPVCYTRDEPHAIDIVAKLSADAAEAFAAAAEGSRYGRYGVGRLPSEDDPDRKFDYTGTTYYYLTVNER